MLPTLLLCAFVTVPRLDAEGVPLPAEVLRRVGSARYRYPAWLSAPVVSADGTRLYTHAGNNRIVVWEAATGRVLHEYKVPAVGRYVISSKVDDQDRPLRFDPRQQRRLDLRPDGRLRVIDAACGELHLCTLDPTTGRVDQNLNLDLPLWDDAELTRDDRWLAAVFFEPTGKGEDKSYRPRLTVYDTATQKAAYAVPIKTTLGCFYFSPDDKWLAVSDEESFRLLDAATGKPVRVLPTRPGELVADFQFSLDSRSVAGLVRKGAMTERVAVWDTATGTTTLDHALRPTNPKKPEPTTDPTRKDPDQTYSLVYRPDVRRLAVIEDNVGVRLLDPATGQQAAVVPEYGAKHGTFSPKGDTFYTAPAGYDALHAIDLRTAPPTVAEPGYGFAHLTFPSNDEFTAFSRGNVVRCDLATGALRLTPFKFPDMAGRGYRDVSPDFKRVASLAFVEAEAGKPTRVEMTLTVTDLGSGRKQVLKGEARWRPSTLDFTPDGTMVVDRSFYNEFSLWDLRTGRFSVVRPKETNGADFSRSQVEIQFGPWFVTTSSATARQVRGRTSRLVRKAGPTCLYDLHDPAKPVWEFVPTADEFSARLVTRDGRGVVAEARENGKTFLELWDGPTGRRQWQQPFPGRVFIPTQSPDGRTLVGDRDGDLLLIETATGRVRHTFRGHRGRVGAAHFSPDGRVLATQSWEAPLYLWDVAGELVKPTTPPDLDAAWDDLAADNASVAFEAGRRLAWFPERSLPYLRAKLPPDTVGADAMAKAIAALDAPAFADREAAMKELKVLGELAVPQLEAALKKTESAEVRERIERLLAAHAARPLTGGDLRTIRAVEVVERIGTPAAKDLLTRWASGAAGARLTREATESLGRLGGAAWSRP